MAVVYFTSNAATGAGSLAEAIQNAQPGDVVRPDETVFERGAVIEIVLASTFIFNKNLTLDASPFRVVLDGDGLPRCCRIAGGANVEITSFRFVGGGWNSQTGAAVGSPTGAGLLLEADANATLNRCEFYGCRGAYGGALSCSDGSTARLNDCVVAGCAASGTCGGVRSRGVVEIYGSTIVGNAGAGGDIFVDASGAGRVTLVNSVVGTYSGNVEIGAGSVVDVASSAVGFVASPPNDLTVENWDADAWQNWDLRLLDDASDAPSPYRDFGDVDKMSRYDLDGNFRGRETNGASTCSPGAYETIQADLFWIGRDATGAEVVSPSFLTSDGWAASRFATASGDAAPQPGQTLFIDGAVTFGDVPSPSSNLTLGLVVGGGANVSTSSTSSTTAVYWGTLTVGANSVYGVSSIPVNVCRVGAWARLTKRLLASLKCEFDANAYIGYGYFYNAKISPIPVYGQLVVAPSALSNVRLDGVYVCDYFKTTDEGTSPTRTIKIGDGATIRAKSATFGASATAPFETLFDKRVTIALQDNASASVGAGAPESWADAFEVDLSETTSATLTLNGQTVYGDASTAAVELSGSAKVDGANSLTVASLTLSEGATVEFTNDASVILTTASATSATATGPGAFFAPIAAPEGLTLENGAVWGDASAGVTSLDVDPVDATTATFTVVKTNADANIVAQYSDDDGATWRTVETTADVDEYELTVAQGADVTVRVATATGWLADTVSTAPFLPVWTVSNAFESVTGVVNAFEVATGGSNDGLNVYDFNDYGYL